MRGPQSVLYGTDALGGRAASWLDAKTGDPVHIGLVLGPNGRKGPWKTRAPVKPRATNGQGLTMEQIAAAVADGAVIAFAATILESDDFVVLALFDNLAGNAC